MKKVVLNGSDLTLDQLVAVSREHATVELAP